MWATAWHHLYVAGNIYPLALLLNLRSPLFALLSAFGQLLCTQETKKENFDACPPMEICSGQVQGALCNLSGAMSSTFRHNSAINTDTHTRTPTHAHTHTRTKGLSGSPKSLAGIEGASSSPTHY